MRGLARLSPFEQLRAGRLIPAPDPARRRSRVVRRVTLGMMIRATLGNAPWDVLPQGIALRLPMCVGAAVILMSLVVLLIRIPLRELPGVGMIANSLAVSPAADLTQPH